MDTLARAQITTSEQLVKALKASLPPANLSASSSSASGETITKIQIARAAWSTTSFRIPKKHQLLSEWILDTLCRSAKSHHQQSAASSSQPGSAKGKAKARTSLAASANASANASQQPACELEADYWALLNQLIQSQINASGTGRLAASQWINKLVSSHSIVTLATSFASLLAQQPQHSSNQALTVSASHVFSALLPSACSRSAAANIENVAETIQTWLAAIPHLDNSSGWQMAAVVLEALVDTWSIALEFGLNARKNARYFLANSLPSYLAALCAVRKSATLPPSGLLASLEQIGAASLFTHDVLLAFVGQHIDLALHPASKDSGIKADQDLLDKVRALAKSEDEAQAEATISSLPVLLRLLTVRLRKAATDLLSPAASTSYSALSAAASMQAQEATVRSIIFTRFLRPIGELMHKSAVKSSQHAALASARAQLLDVVEALDLYVPGSQEAELWTAFFQSVLGDAIDDIRYRYDEEAQSHTSVVAERAFESLQTLWRLEQLIVEPWLTAILREVATVRVEVPAWDADETFDAEATASLSFLKTAVTSHARARDMPRFVVSLFKAVTQLPETASASMKQVQNGVLLSAVSTAEIASAVRDFLTPMQLVPLVDLLREKADEIVGEVSTTKHRAESPRPSKRRRSDTDGTADAVVDGSANGNGETASQHSKLALQVLALALVNMQIPAPVRDDAIVAVERLYVDVILPSLDLGLARKDGALLSAALAARYSLFARSWRINFNLPIRLDGSPETESLEVLHVSLNERFAQLVGLLAKDQEGGRDSVSGEAVVEIVKALLQRAERDFVDRREKSEYTALLSNEGQSPLVTSLLPIIRKDLVSSGSRDIDSVGWNGRTTGIDGASALASALWLMFTSRWAELIDQLGSNRLLMDLSQILLASVVIDPSTSILAGISRKAVRNAHLLELPRWRSTLLSIVNTKTQILAKEEYVKKRPTLAILDRGDAAAATTGSATKSPTELQEALLTLCAMERFPVEWISKSSRETLLERSLTLDAMRASTLAITTQQSTSLRRLIGGLMLARGAGPDAASKQMAASLALLVSGSAIHPEEAETDGGRAAVSEQHDEISLAAFEVGARNLVESCRVVPTAWANLVALHHFLAARSAFWGGAMTTLAARADQALLAGLVGDAKLLANAEHVEAFWHILIASRPMDEQIDLHFEAVRASVFQQQPTAVIGTAGLMDLVYHLKQVRLALNLADACSAAMLEGAGRAALHASAKQQVLSLLQPICVAVGRVTASVEARDESSERGTLRAALRVCAETLQLLADCSSPTAPTPISNASSDGDGDVDMEEALPSDGQNDDASAALETALAFASFASCLEREELVDTLSPVLVRIVSRLSSEAYDRYLSDLLQVVTAERASLHDTASTAVATTEVDEQSRDRSSLIIAAGLSLQSNQEGASNRSARTHLTKLLSFFVRLGSTSTSPVVFHAMVEVIESISSRKATLLRHTDVELICQLFGSMLVPSNLAAPWPATVAAPAQMGRKIFNDQVSTLTSLIRLRPDLIHAYLSHVAGLLSSLSTLFRRPKEVKSSAAVAAAAATKGAAGSISARYLRRDLPFWFDPVHSHALRCSVEARHFSRLLTSLTLKTSSLTSRRRRANGSIKERKAESLSKPFSKHAIYVLVAYLNAVTNPASTLPNDVRLELSSGLMALCSVVGKYERDAAMVGLLDSAGKTLFKTMWKRWEGERYRGQ